MNIGSYGSRDFILYMSTFPNFEDIASIRKSLIEYDIVLIIDSSIEAIKYPQSLFEFHRKLKGTKFILLYEKKEMLVYSRLFDKCINIRMSDMSSDVIDSILFEAMAEELHDNKDKLLPIDVNYDNIRDEYEHMLLDQEKNMSTDVEILRNTVANLNKQIVELLINSRTASKEMERMSREIAILTSQNSAIRNQAAFLSDLLVESEKRNDSLLKLKESFMRTLLEETGSEYVSINLDSLNTRDVTLLVINEIEDMLFTRTFLKLLKFKIERVLGLATKVIVLEDTPKKYDYFTDYYRVVNTYNNSIYGSEFILKVGYSQQFISDMLSDPSEPSVIIIFNSIPSLFLDAPNSANFYAMRGNPNKHAMSAELINYTITNAEGFPLSFEFDSNYQEMLEAGLAPTYLIDRNVMQLIMQDLESILKAKSNQRIQEEYELYGRIK